MSRGQSTQAFNTASNENATDFGNAQSAFGSTENAIGNYNNQLAKFVSGNPYTKGGEYDQTINTGLANVSDAGANSLAGRAAVAGPANGPEQRRRCGHRGGRGAAEHPQSIERPGQGAAAAHSQRSRLQPGGAGRVGRSRSAPTSRSTALRPMRPIACWAMKPRRPKHPASGMKSAAALPAI